MEAGVFKWPWNMKLEKPYRSCFTLLIDDYAPWRVLRPQIDYPLSFFRDLNSVFERNGLSCAKYSICPLADGINWMEDEGYRGFVEELVAAQDMGISIGLEGLTHYLVYDFCSKTLTNLREADLFNNGSEEQIYEYLKGGVEILERKGLRSSGFTSPFFCGDQINAYRAFNRLGWVWSFNTMGKDQGNDPVLRHGTVCNLPSYWKSPDLFGGGGAPPPTEVREDLARACINAAYLDGEMCALYTHFEGIFFSGALDKLEDLLKWVKEREDIWMASPEEIANFWVAKENLRYQLAVQHDTVKNILYIRGYFTSTRAKNLALWVVPPPGKKISEAKIFYDKKEFKDIPLVDKGDYIVMVIETKNRKNCDITAYLEKHE